MEELEALMLNSNSNSGERKSRKSWRSGSRKLELKSKFV